MRGVIPKDVSLCTFIIQPLGLPLILEWKGLNYDAIAEHEGY